jgi:hypothetical protein
VPQPGEPEEWRAVVEVVDDEAVAAVRELDTGFQITGDGNVLIAYADRRVDAEALRDQLVELLRHRSPVRIEAAIERWYPGRAEWLPDGLTDREPDPAPNVEPTSPGVADSVVGTVLDFLFERP